MDTNDRTTQPITSSPDVMSGAPVFAGTRVPVQTLIDYLEGFRTVKREQVTAFLEEAKERMIDSLRSEAI